MQKYLLAALAVLAVGGISEAQTCSGPYCRMASSGAPISTGFGSQTYSGVTYRVVSSPAPVPVHTVQLGTVYTTTSYQPQTYSGVTYRIVSSSAPVSLPQGYSVVSYPAQSYPVMPSGTVVSSSTFPTTSYLPPSCSGGHCQPVYTVPATSFGRTCVGGSCSR